MNLSPLFRDLNPRQREQLRPLFTHCSFPGNEMLFDQGDVAEFLYLVVSGEVLVKYKPEDAPEIVVAKVKPGGIVGWSAALGSRHYTSGAITVEATDLICIRGSDLRRLCSLYPETGILVLERLADVIAERLHSTHQEVVALLKHGMQNQVALK